MKFIFSSTVILGGLFIGIAFLAKNDISHLFRKPNKSINLAKIITSGSQQESEVSKSSVSLQEAFVKVADKVGPAVVSIVSERTETAGGGFFTPFGGDEFFNKFFRDFFGEVPKRKFKEMGLGSGIIIDPQGYILTNEHVIHNADKITVTLPDSRELKAKLVGKDIRSDLAVLKINTKNLPYAKLGDSDKVEIGQWAIAIGNPFGFAVNSPKPTITVGVISALHRSLPSTEYRERIYNDLIQTDAAINPGNSGGPLVNIEGEVIGINVAIYTTSGGYQGIGFAIPINQAKFVLGKLVKGEEVEYGWLGVQIQDVNSDLAKYFALPDTKGALVAKVLKNSPASKAGIKEGDIIREYNGKRILDTKDLLNKVMHTPVGRNVEVKVWRDKKEISLNIKIAKRPKFVEETQAQEGITWRGMTVNDITDDLKKKYGITEAEGVVVTKVKEDTPSWEADIREGDIIHEINRIKIKNLNDFKNAISGIEGQALVRTSRGYILINP
jgi:serine protease Do